MPVRPPSSSSPVEKQPGSMSSLELASLASRQHGPNFCNFTYQPWHSPSDMGGCHEQGSVPGRLLRRQRLEHAELVSVRIGHNDPAGLVALADIDAPRA